jgi:hypothetical protein
MSWSQVLGVLLWDMEQHREKEPFLVDSITPIEVEDFWISFNKSSNYNKLGT